MQVSEIFSVLLLKACNGGGGKCARWVAVALVPSHSGGTTSLSLGATDHRPPRQSSRPGTAVAGLLLLTACSRRGLLASRSNSQGRGREQKHPSTNEHLFPDPGSATIRAYPRRRQEINPQVQGVLGNPNKYRCFIGDF